MIGVILVMAIRIAYVNITYPSTDIKIIKNKVGVKLTLFLYL